MNEFNRLCHFLHGCAESINQTGIFMSVTQINDYGHNTIEWKR